MVVYFIIYHIFYSLIFMTLYIHLRFLFYIYFGITCPNFRTDGRCVPIYILHGSSTASYWKKTGSQTTCIEKYYGLSKYCFNILQKTIHYIHIHFINTFIKCIINISVLQYIYINTLFYIYTHFINYINFNCNLYNFFQLISDFCYTRYIILICL